MDVDKCLKNNIHNRTESDIRKALKEWEPTPSSYTVLDYECLFNSADNTEAISDADDDNEDAESLDAISDDENASGADKNMHDDFSDIGDDEPINEVTFFSWCKSHFFYCILANCEWNIFHDNVIKNHLYEMNSSSS